MLGLYLKLNKNKSYWLKLLCIVVPVFLAMIFFNLSNWLLILVILITAVIFIFCKDHLWILLLISLPLITFGQFIYAEIQSGWIYEVSMTEILLLLIFCVYVLDKFLNSKFADTKFNLLSLLLLLYTFFSISTIGKAKDLHFYVGENKVFVFAFLAYFLSLNLIDTTKKFKCFILSLAGTVFIFSAQIFYKFYQMGFSSDIFFRRNEIIMPVGALALVVAIIAMSMPLLIGYYFQTDNSDKKKPFYFIALLVNWLAVFISLGKGAILSLLSGVAFVFGRLKEKRLVIMIAFLVFSISALVFLMPYSKGLTSRFANALSDKNSQYRIAEYEISWKLIKDYPMGLGAGQQPIYFRKEFRDTEFHNYVNNFLLQAQLDLGIPGLIFLLAICFYLIISFYKWNKLELAKKDKMILSGFVGTMIAVFLNSLVEVTVYALNYAIVLWFMIGAIYSYFGYKKYENINNNN